MFKTGFSALFLSVVVLSSPGAFAAKDRSEYKVVYSDCGSDGCRVNCYFPKHDAKDDGIWVRYSGVKDLREEYWFNGSTTIAFKKDKSIHRLVIRDGSSCSISNIKSFKLHK